MRMSAILPVRKSFRSSENERREKIGSHHDGAEVGGNPQARAGTAPGASSRTRSRSVEIPRAGPGRPHFQKNRRWTELVPSDRDETRAGPTAQAGGDGERFGETRNGATDELAGSSAREWTSFELTVQTSPPRRAR